jgi:predicted CXXCH cytochrome family protein
MRRAGRAGVTNCLAVLLGLLAAGPVVSGQTARRYVGTPVLTFNYQVEPALHMPTGVSVAEDGTVFVADGVNDRILVFSALGEYREEIRTAGAETFSRPISVKVDRSGALWIADSGHGRALVRAPDGSLRREIRVPEPAEGGQVPDITDVVVSPDGRRVWLADNHNHHLVQLDLESEQLRVLGGLGEGLGQLYHPFMLAVSAAGDVVVSEPVGGRAQVYNAAGEPVGTLGAFGVNVGDLYRPKGVAVDGAGNVWVADGVLGVIQIFDITGNILDVLRDTTEGPLKLDVPCGIALDRAGNLYVAELTAHRVRKIAITVNPQAPVQQAPGRPTSVGGAPQPQACTVCHLEWVEPLAHGESTLLTAPPPNTPDQPYVSRQETCLSCHDGAVVDSRRRVWVEHGHRTGVTPPPNINVPPFLPLVNGQIVCRTCHSAHGLGPPTADIARAVFLRIPNPASELCISCHADKAGGREAGTHPIGGMPWPVPENLLSAGAKVGPNPRELTCQVCHTPHGAAHEHLLVLGTESSQLCLSCHDQMRPGMFRAGGQAEHPLSPLVNAEQKAAIEGMGTKVGPGDHLICLSCHRLHHGKGQRFLLADNLAEGQMCLRCHEGRRAVLNTPHDLRQNFPEERDRLGLTAHTGGPCSACHLFHRYARAPEASPVDPGGGKCITCHQPGRVAEGKVLGNVNHPPIGCTKCHNPHTEQNTYFLRNTAYAVCASCHAEQGRLINGPHDMVASSADWPPVAAATHDTCRACHRPHGDEETGLFRAGTRDGASRDDGLCIACHPGVALDSTGPLTFLHPRDATKLKDQPDLPLDIGDGTKSIACRTCHNPHHGGPGKALLRTPPGAGLQVLCITCHADKAHIAAIGHAAPVLRAAGFSAEGCEPCHVIHDAPDQVMLPLMWPKQLAYPATETQPVRAADRYCDACHYVGGPVAPPAIATHPRVDMFNPTAADSPGYLPLFNDQGEIDPQGTLGCRTCHFTHGRSTPAPLPPVMGTGTTREMRARAWHIRSIGWDSVCVTCHGFDALRRFMYFHDAVRRGGPLQQ